MIQQGIAYVTSAITLVAFLAATGLAVVRTLAARKESLIKAARPSERGRLVEQALEVFKIDASKLTKQQQFELALEQLHARRHRFTVISALIFVVALIFGGITAFSIWKTPGNSHGGTPPQTKADAVDDGPMYTPTPIDPDAIYQVKMAWVKLNRCEAALCDVRLYLDAVENPAGRRLLSTSHLVSSWSAAPRSGNGDTPPPSFKRLSLDEDKIQFKGKNTVSIRLGCEVQNGDVQYGRLTLNASNLHSIYSMTCQNDWATVEAGFQVTQPFGAPVTQVGEMGSGIAIAHLEPPPR